VHVQLGGADAAKPNVVVSARLGRNGSLHPERVLGKNFWRSRVPKEQVRLCAVLHNHRSALQLVALVEFKDHTRLAGLGLANVAHEGKPLVGLSALCKNYFFAGNFADTLVRSRQVIWLE